MPTFNKVWIDALLNQADSSKRFYPMANSGGLRNFSTTRDTPIMQEFDGGGKIFIRDAVRTVEFLVTGSAATPRNEGVINGFRCAQYGVYIVDRGGNLAGNLSSSSGACGTCSCNSDYKNTGVACSSIMRDPYNLIWVPLYDVDGNANGIQLTSGAYLYPIPVDQESVYATLQFNNAKDNAQQLMVRFDFQQDFKDATLNFIPCTSFTDFSMLTVRGLYDVCPEVLEADTNGMTVKLLTADGDAENPTLVQGLVAADFVINNVTQGSPIGFTGTGGSFTETSAHEFEFVFDTADQPTNGDVLQLVPTKNGYDFTCVEDTDIAVPTS